MDRGAMRSIGLALVCALGMSRAHAQVYVVDANGTEGFKDLQVALDTVPDGSTLLVKGPPWEQNAVPYLVHKSVTIVGWNVDAGTGPTELGSHPVVLEIDAGPDAAVTLKDVSINGGWAWGPSFEGIHVTSVGDLVLRDCEVIGGQGLADVCEYYFKNGDAIVIDAARSVSIVGSRVVGGGPGTTLWSESWCPDMHQAYGGDAIVSAADALLVIDSEVTGGRGADVGYYCGYDGSDAPWEPIGSDGGDAIDATGVTWVSGSTVTGGAPGQGLTMGCTSDLGQPGNPGDDFSGAHADLPDLLTATDALLGQPITLSGIGFEPAKAALTFLSFSIAPPVALRQGEWFLDVPFFFIGAFPTDGAGRFTLATTFPDDPALIGTTLVAQATDLVRMSEPIVLVPRRRKP